MRISMSLKLVGVVILGLATSLVTSQLHAQYLRSKVKPSSPTGRTTIADAPGAKSGQPRKLANVVKTAEMKDFKVEISGRTVDVSCYAKLFETQHESNYLWSYRIVSDSPQRTLVAEQHYTDQVFSLSDPRDAPLIGDNVMNPTFHTQVRLVPGNYLVEVTLFNFAKAVDVSILKDETKRALLPKVSIVEKISIRD